MNAKAPVNNEMEGRILKFDMSSDEDIRTAARKGYEVSKIFKEAGIEFRKIVSAHDDESIRKLFKLGPSGPNFCLEILLEGNEEENLMAIETVKDQFLLLPDYSLVNDKTYKLDSFRTVHRFLFRPSK